MLTLNYSAKWEILRATRLLAEQTARKLLNPTKINKHIFKNTLNTRTIPYFCPPFPLPNLTQRAMTDLKAQIIPDKIPRHIAIIMNGNGRWAKQKGLPQVLNHHNNMKSVREMTETTAKIKIKYLTLYAFSTKNWNRPPAEVTALINLLIKTIRSKIHNLNKNDIHLTTIS